MLLLFYLSRLPALLLLQVDWFEVYLQAQEERGFEGSFRTFLDLQVRTAACSSNTQIATAYSSQIAYAAADHGWSILTAGGASSPQVLTYCYAVPCCAVGSDTPAAACRFSWVSWTGRPLVVSSASQQLTTMGRICQQAWAQSQSE
jgi:hypothetical protein